MSQDRGDRRLAEVGGLVAVDAVAIHHSEHPQAWDSCQITLDAVAVLVDFAHLRDEPGASLDTKLLNKLKLGRSLPASKRAHLLLLACLETLIGVLLLSPDIKPSEIRSLLQLLVALVSQWIDLNQVIAADVWRRITVGMLVLLILALEDLRVNLTRPYLVAGASTALTIVLLHESGAILLLTVHIHVCVASLGAVVGH